MKSALNRRLSLTALAAASAAAPLSNAQLLAYEGFNYAPGADVLTVGNAGFGWQFPWNNAGVPTWLVDTEGSTFSIYGKQLQTIGKRATSQWSVIQRTINLGGGQTLDSFGTIWISFIMDAGEPLGNQVWAGLQLPCAAGSANTQLFIGKQQNDARYGLSGGPGTNGVFADTRASHRSLIVVRIDFGGPFANDFVRMWVDPRLNNNAPLLNTADAAVQGQFRGITKILMDVGGLGTRPTTIDEIRVGRSWGDVTPHVSKHANCGGADHTLTLQALPGKTLDIEATERTRDRVNARSRKCHNTDKDQSWPSTQWAPLPQNPSRASVGPMDSWAKATSGVNVFTYTSTEFAAETFAKAEGEAYTTGCNTNRRKHAAHARAVAHVKSRVKGKLYDAQGGYDGQWKNCITGSARTPGLLKDPVDLFLRDLGTGQISKQNLIDLTSLVWDGETEWDFNDDIRWLRNTASKMELHASVTSPFVAAAQHGALDIVCDHGSIQQITGTGVFASLVRSAQNPGGPLAQGGSSQFQVDFPTLRFDLQIPGTPATVETTLEAGGGLVVQPVDVAASTGCNIYTGLANGVGEQDTSSPRNGDLTLGVVADGTLSWIAQPFTVSGNQRVQVDSVGMVAYQPGMPYNGAPTVASAYAAVYDGPPWLATSNLVAGGMTTAQPAEVEWMEVFRTYSTSLLDDSRPVMEISLDDLTGTLQPGPHWIVVAVERDPHLAPAEMVPCPYDDAGGSAYVFDAIAGTWHQATDAGSGRALRFPIDVFVSEVDGCPADFNQDGFLDFFDLDAFLQAFDGGVPGADFNGDGFVDFFDIDSFIGAFETGC